jgi:hypothetical protein
MVEMVSWLVEPAPINGSQEVVINQAETTADNAFYVLAPNPHQFDWTFQQHSGEGEYFLIENRQLLAWIADCRGADYWYGIFTKKQKKTIWQIILPRL